MKPIRKIQQTKNRLQQVIAILSTPDYVEKQIKFGRSETNEFGHQICICFNLNPAVEQGGGQVAKNVFVNHNVKLKMSDQLPDSGSVVTWIPIVYDEFYLKV